MLLAVAEHRAVVVSKSISTLCSRPDHSAESSGRPFDRAVAGAALERLTVALDDYDLSSASGAMADLSRQVFCRGRRRISADFGTR